MRAYELDDEKSLDIIIMDSRNPDSFQEETPLETSRPRRLTGWTEIAK